jgi:hypothetical protein
MGKEQGNNNSFSILLRNLLEPRVVVIFIKMTRG